MGGQQAVRRVDRMTDKAWARLMREQRARVDEWRAGMRAGKWTRTDVFALVGTKPAVSPEGMVAADKAVAAPTPFTTTTPPTM